MKKVIIGASFMFFGLFAASSILLVATLYAPALTEWQTNLGKIWTVIFENYLLIPFIVATAIMILGILMLGRAYFGERE